MSALLAFLIIPLVTGATSAFWAPITQQSWTAVAALNAGTYAMLWLALLVLRPDDPGLMAVARTLGWWPIATYVALSICVAAGWFVAQEGTHVVWIAVGEMAWPAYVLVSTKALARWTDLPVKAPDITLPHVACAALIVVGAAGLAVIEARPRAGQVGSAEPGAIGWDWSAQ